MILNKINSMPESPEKIKFMVDNQKRIIAEKMAYQWGYKRTAHVRGFKNKRKSANKSAISNESNIIPIVGNTTMVIDSYMDVSNKGSFDHIVDSYGSEIKIFKNHRSWDVDQEISFNRGIFVEDVQKRDVGIDQDGDVQVFGINTEPFDDETRSRYESGRYNQHSIGMWYEELRFAVNDEEYESQYKNWVEMYDNILNKDIADEYGYFWIVDKQGVFETSVVPFGANKFTPPLNKENYFSSSDSEKFKDNSDISEPNVKESFISYM